MNANESRLRQLNDCGCCEGQTAATPVEIVNRPGLSQIAYRVGTHSRFKESMLARLSATALPALQKLKTRDDDDFTIALLDAWANVADILSFYQERIANESYLGTAVERLSLLELARLIDYAPAPGVAAETYLAFILDEAPGAPDQETKSTSVATGTKVQSTPGPGEHAQTFETVEPITAHVECNAIRPRVRSPHPIADDLHEVVLQGAVTGPRKGDLIAVIQNGVPLALHVVAGLASNLETGATKVSFVNPPIPIPIPLTVLPPPLGKIDDFAPETVFDQSALKQLVSKKWAADDLCALADIQGWELAALSDAINAYTSRRVDSVDSGVFVFRQRAALFGHNAMKMVKYKLPPDETVPEPQSAWTEWSADTSEKPNRAYLDVAYDELVPGGYAVIQTSGATTVDENDVYSVTSVVTAPRSEYGLTGKSTQLTFDRDWWSPSADQTTFAQIRGTTVFAQSEQMPLADVFDETPVKDDRIVLDGAYLGLKSGQAVAVSGERIDLPGLTGSEVRVLHEVWIINGFTVLVLQQALDHVYVRDSVRINANVARATHGETVHEALGSGDARKTYQRFVLKQSPLTYVSADIPSGIQSTLEVRVNKLLWTEVPSLLGQGPKDHVYVTRIDDQGRTLVLFGDGINGARLPTGQDNVRATYRRGIGLGGLLKAKQLNQLMSRPLGVRGAINPRPTTGGDGPESRDDVRRNAPSTVLTLDRAVSLQDYEDISRAFAGIAKAKAIWAWNGRQRELFITVAGPNGKTIEKDGPIQTNLISSLHKAGDPFVDITVASYRSAFFRIEGGITVDPAYEAEFVIEGVHRTLRQAFSFDPRDFGQPVFLSETVAVIQKVPGVVAVDIDALFRTDLQTGSWQRRPIAAPAYQGVTAQIPKGTVSGHITALYGTARHTGSLQTHLMAEPAHQASGGQMIAAELLTLDPAPLDKLRVLA